MTLITINVVHRYDVRVLEFCEHPRFALESSYELFVISQLRGESLDCHDAIRLLISGAISISSATYSKIRQGLFWAFIYNIVGIPLAAFGVLNPMFAGAAMAMSSVSVVLNALMLLRWKPG